MEKVIKLFEEKGWKYEVAEDGVTVISGFTTEPTYEEGVLEEGEKVEVGFNLYVFRVTDEFDDLYRFTITPFAKDWNFVVLGQDLLITLLTWNHDLVEARFSIDGDGDVELILDVFADKLDKEEFDRVLQVLVDVCAQTYNSVEAQISENMRYLKRPEDEILVNMDAAESVDEE